MYRPSRRTIESHMGKRRSGGGGMRATSRSSREACSQFLHASQALRDGLEHLPEPLVSLPTALDDHVLAPQAVSSSSGAPVLPTVPGGGS